MTPLAARYLAGERPANIGAILADEFCARRRLGNPKLGPVERQNIDPVLSHTFIRAVGTTRA